MSIIPLVQIGKYSESVPRRRVLRKHNDFALIVCDGCGTTFYGRDVN